MYNPLKTKYFIIAGSEVPFNQDILYCIVYLYSAQYLHILQDSKRYMTHLTVQVQPQLTSNSHSPLTERQRLKDDHLSTSLRFFSLPLRIRPNDWGHPSHYVSAFTWDWIHVLCVPQPPIPHVFVVATTTISHWINSHSTGLGFCQVMYLKYCQSSS